MLFGPAKSAYWFQMANAGLALAPARLTSEPWAVIGQNQREIDQNTPDHTGKDN